MLSLLTDDNATRLLPIADIRRDGGTQPRDGINQLHVADMRIALQQDKPLPPVEIIYDGESYWLWDGFHRIEAHIIEERTTIAANVRQGTLQDAQWESYSVNAGHGLKRSNADKERQIRNALRHPNAQGMSNVQVAKHVGVDDKTVARYRAEMQAASEIPSLSSRQGADGKNYPASAPRPAPGQLAARLQRLVNDGWGFSGRGATPQRGAHHRSYTGPSYVEFDTEQAAVEFAEQAMRKKPLAAVAELVAIVVNWLDTEIDRNDHADVLQQTDDDWSVAPRNLEAFLDEKGVAWTRSDLKLALTHVRNQIAIAAKVAPTVSELVELPPPPPRVPRSTELTPKSGGEPPAVTGASLVDRLTNAIEQARVLTGGLAADYGALTDDYETADEIDGLLKFMERAIKEAVYKGRDRKISPK